jgi:hypothetical protein
MKDGTKENDRIFGYLLTIDIYGVESSRCQDLNLGYDFLDKLPNNIGMEKQSLPHIYVTPSEWAGKGGLSGWVGIVDSGIQLHTLSDTGFVTVDLYTCSYLDKKMIPKILKFVDKYYPYEDVETNLMKRGSKYYQEQRCLPQENQMFKEDIPIFPEFRDLRLEDRRALLSYFQPLQTEISDRCFTNLFIWQDFYNIQISQFNDNICLFSASNTTPEKEFFFPPLGQNNILENLNACLDFMSSRNMQPIIRRASEKFLQIHLTNQNKFVAKQDLNISDYIYWAEYLRTLPGPKYHPQRNFIKRFKKKYPDYTTEFLNQENIQECIQFNDKWLQIKLQALSKKIDVHSEPLHDEVVFLKAEVDTARKILLNFEELELTGLAVRIGGDVHAFTIGEKLNDQTALIHIEKAYPGHVGLYQFLSQTFCQQAWSDCEYINRMEDLGIEGLRKTKMALHPHHMAKKYNITLRESV